MGKIVRLTGLILGIATAWGQPAESARKSYNEMYRETAKVYTTAPNGFLTRMMAGRKPGRALDIAMGQGRNALWLSEQGWDVTGIDISDEGVAQARAAAQARGLRLRAERAGYAEFAYGDAQWDLIVLCYFLPRDLPARIREAVKPGGFVLIEGFHADTAFVRLLPEGWRDNELLSLFPGFRVVQYEDVEAAAEWGGALSAGNRIVRLLVQRPESAPLGCRFQERQIPRGGTVCWGKLALRCEATGWVRADSCENSGKND